MVIYNSVYVYEHQLFTSSPIILLVIPKGCHGGLHPLVLSASHLGHHPLHQLGLAHQHKEDQHTLIKNLNQSLIIEIVYRE